MCPGNTGQGSSANGDRNAQRSLKAYKAPQFEILTPDQAAAWLRAKGMPGDAVDWTPRLRQPVKLHFAVRCRSVVGRG
jgi:hypothetical protein